MLLIFDWDGTLIDSAKRIVGCLRLAAADAGLPLLSDAAYADIIGLGLHEAIQALYPGISGVQARRLRDGYADHFISADAAPSSFFPGAKQALYTLRAQGHRLAVATGKSRRGLDRALCGLEVAHLFEVTRCADETASKPHPRMLQEILAATGEAAERALMVGDTEYDLAMANAAGVPAVAVSYGVHSLPRLQRHDPRYVINNMSEIIDLIE